MAKYKVYGNYVFTKVLGEYEAESEEDAVKMALNEASVNGKLQFSLCGGCAREFCDNGELDENSCFVDSIEE